MDSVHGFSLEDGSGELSIDSSQVIKTCSLTEFQSLFQCINNVINWHDFFLIKSIVNANYEQLCQCFYWLKSL